MKKLIATLLALVMVLSLAACGNDETPETTDPVETTTTPTETTAPVVSGPASALEMMETIWNTWEFEYKDYFMGGGYTNMVSGVPGEIELTDTDALQALLYIPEANLADVQSAASAMHAMNANTFTAAAIQVADAAAFAATMQDTLMNNQWICGFPETLMVYTLGTDYVVIVFGTADNVDGFRTAMTTAYADVVSVYDGAMG